MMKELIDIIKLRWKIFYQKKGVVSFEDDVTVQPWLKQISHTYCNTCTKRIRVAVLKLSSFTFLKNYKKHLFFVVHLLGAPIST